MPVKHFGVITETRVVDGSVEQVFDFLADFSTTQQWDPVRAPAIPPSHLPSAQPPVSVTPIPSFYFLPSRCLSSHLNSCTPSPYAF